MLKLVRLFLYHQVVRGFIYFGHKSFVVHVVCQSFLPGCSLSFWSLNNILCRAEVFNFDEFQFFNFFYGPCFWSSMKNTLLNPES